MAEDRTDPLSALCSLGTRPTLITGYLRQWFMAHFSVAARIENPQLRSKLWNENRLQTEIEVEDVLRWKPSTTEFRPALLIARNDYKVLRFGIDDRMMGTDWDARGVAHHAGFLEGSHTVFAVSNLPAEAELLGGEVYRELHQFGPTIREELDLKRFAVGMFGKAFEIEEARGNYAVPVPVGCAAEETWQILPHAPFLKRIVISEFLP